MTTTAPPLPEPWLHGWPRNGAIVLMGTMWHCAGCGSERGLGCVALDNEPYPDVLPEWPFPRENCPVCFLMDRLPQEPEDKLAKRARLLERLKAAEVEIERVRLVAFNDGYKAGEHGVEVRRAMGSTTSGEAP